MSISEPFIRRPVGTTLLTIGLLISGLVAFRKLPVAALPQVDYPTIVVATSLPGASAETMASAVTTPLERQFGQMPSASRTPPTRPFSPWRCRRKACPSRRSTTSPTRCWRRKSPRCPEWASSRSTEARSPRCACRSTRSRWLAPISRWRTCAPRWWRPTSTNPRAPSTGPGRNTPSPPMTRLPPPLASARWCWPGRTARRFGSATSPMPSMESRTTPSPDGPTPNGPSS